jgi:hypothetical protein
MAGMGHQRSPSPPLQPLQAVPRIITLNRRDPLTLPGAVIHRPAPGGWHPRMPERLDEEELADRRAGRNAVYQLTALSIGARLVVAEHLFRTCYVADSFVQNIT